MLRPAFGAFLCLALAASILGTIGCGQSCKDAHENDDVTIWPAMGPAADPCDAGLVKDDNSRCVYPDGGVPPPVYSAAQVNEILSQPCDQFCRGHFDAVTAVNACEPAKPNALGYYFVHCDVTYTQCGSTTPALLK